tara:strand:+ start:456 stop:851 length:396 start_codon:yes stop_codon:yes gene_type:complete
MANTDYYVSFVAAEAITEYALVSVDVAGKITITDAATEDNCVGVAQRACNAGDTVEVIVYGCSRAIAGGNIAPATMNLLMATTDGKLVAFDGATSKYAVARMIPNINQVSASSGDQIKVVFTGPSNLTQIS